MKKNLITFALAIIPILCFAQVSENRTVASFSKIDVESGISLTFTESKTTSIKVQADDNEKLGRILTDVVDGVLKIHFKSGKNSRNKTANVEVSAANVNGFEAGSGATIKLTNEVTASNASIHLDSGSRFTGSIKSSGNTTLDADSGSAFKGKITTTILKIDLDSGVSVHLSGSANTTTVNIDSGSSLHAEDFTTLNAIIDADSASSTDITVTESLKAKASSAAVIRYYGDPKKVDVTKDSAAVITKK